MSCVLLALTSRALTQEPLFTFAQISDTQPPTETAWQDFEDVLQVIAEGGQSGAFLPRAVDLVLFAGDITDANKENEWVRARGLLDTWLTANQIPFLAVPGNHDVNNGDASLFEQYIGNSDPWQAGSAAFTGQNGITKTTNWEGLRFIGFNNSNPGDNTISAGDLAAIQSYVAAAAAAAENVLLLCHHPHNEHDRVPLVNVLPEPSIVLYARGHLGSPHATQGLTSINNPNVWDCDSNALYQDKDLIYYEAYPTELRAYVIIFDNNPTGLPAPRIITLAHPLRPLAEPDIGFPGASHTAARPFPSGEAPERKLWNSNGSWWGILWSQAASSYGIFRLNASNQTWIDTGTIVSTNAAHSFDVLPDGSRVYIARHVAAVPSQAGAGDPGRVTRLTYNAGSNSYTTDTGFPVAVNDARTETLVLAKDSTGTLWASWTQGGAVLVNQTLGDDLTWGTPLVLPFPEASGLNAEDTSALIAFGGSVGVMWTDRNAGRVEFAIHVDGAAAGSWSLETALAASGAVAEGLDLAASAGRVFGATRTPAGDVRLLERSAAPAGTWTLHGVASAAASLSDPVLVVDQSHSLLRLLAVGPTLEGAGEQGGGAIYEKDSPLAAIAFPPGRGTPVVQDGTNPALAGPTSTRQAVTSSTGLAVLASNEATQRYWHAFSAAAAPLAPPSASFSGAPLSGPAPLVVQFTDLTTGAPTSWQWDFGDGGTSTEQDPSHLYAQAGVYNVTLVAANGGGSSTSVRTGYIDVSLPPLVQTFSPVADARVYEGSPGSNYGTSDPLRVKDVAGGSYRSFLKFDLSSLAGTVTGARLRLFCTDGGATGGTFYAVGNAWTETGVTWNNKPALPPGALGSLAGVTAGFWYEVNVTAAITGPGVFSFGIAGGTTNSVYYSSREGTNPPQLVVDLAQTSVPPVANFTASPLAGAAPLSVAFTDLSTGGPTTYLWAFGDGNISNERNPVHVYAEPGTYSVLLQVSNGAGSDSLSRNDLIAVTPPPPITTHSPVADARVSQRSANKNYGADSVLRVEADAGAQHQSYLKFDLSALTASVFSAHLRIFCTDSSTGGGSLYVVGNGWTETGLTWNTKPALPPSPVASLGAVTSGAWFELDVSSVVTGPGIVSFALAGGSTNAAYYSSREGANPPRLVVETGSVGAPVADFGATPLSGPVPLAVSFTDLSSGPPTSWLWTFGDGATSTERNPVHVYTQLGTYSVTLEVSNSSSADSLTLPDLITVTPPLPIATLLPVMDARVSEGSPTSNYGTTAVLRVVATAGSAYHTYLRFDLSGVGGAPTSARLRLFVTDPSPVGGLVFPTSSGWTETGITWANKPSATGGQIASAGSVAAGAWVEFDVTSAVTAPTVVNFLITSTSTNSAYFSSREGANPPELVVETQ